MRPARKSLKMDVIVQRQLDTMTTGNAAYLAIFLRTAREGNAKVRLIFAPERSFGNRPWMRIHEEFLDLTSSQTVPRSIKFGQTYWSMRPRVWWRFGVRLLKEASSRAGFSPKVHSYLGDPLEPTEANFVTRTVATEQPDIVVAEYSSLAPLLEKMPFVPNRAVLLHDLFSLRAAQFRQGGHTPDFREVTLEEEAAQCRAATLCLYASRNEMNALNEMLPRAASIWIPPEPPVFRVNNIPQAAHSVYLGTRHAGNVDALQHLLDDIWPIVLGKRPDAVLKVAGSICADVTPAQAALPGVELLGRVDSLESLSGADAIGLAPTRLASGVSIKVAEYLMLGMPTIVHTKALEGFSDVLDDLAVIEDSDEGYAAQIIALLDDRSRRMKLSHKGLTEVMHRLSNRELVAYLRGADRVSAPRKLTELDANHAEHEDMDALLSIGR